MCSEQKGRGEGTGTRAHSGLGSGSSGWGGATSKVGCKTSKGDSLALSMQGAAAPRDLPTLGWSRGEGESTSRSTGPGTLRASPSWVGFHWDQLGRLCAAKETLVKPQHRSPRSKGETRKSSVSSVPERASVPGRDHGSSTNHPSDWRTRPGTQGGTTEAQPIIPQTGEQGPGLNACMLGKWRLHRAIGPARGRQEAGPTPTPRSSQNLVLVWSQQSAASHELKKIKRNKQPHCCF